MLTELNSRKTESWKKVGEVLDEEMSTVEDIIESLAKSDNGKTLQSIENCVIVLERDPLLRGKIRRNELTCRTDIVGEMKWNRTSPTINDTDMFQIQRYMEKIYGLYRDTNVNKAIKIVESENSYHPIKGFLESLQWDRKPRIRYLLPKFLGAEESNFTEEAMNLVMMASIKRIYEPGCKFEIMMCLIGGQGVGKSTFFRFLACKDEWFSDDLKRLDDDNVYRKMQGHWIIEMSEMLATVNARSIEDIKSFLSRQKETYKIPYETHPEDRPRQCVFVGTSNNMDFLPLDRTGNRRFIPILCHPENVDHHIMENEEESRYYILQAWAEAMELFRNSKVELKLSTEAESHLRELQKDFMPEDTKVGIISAWLENCGRNEVCALMIYREALHHDERECPQRWETSEIKSIMNESITGWEQLSSFRFGAGYGTQRGWRRTGDGFTVVSDEEVPFK